MSVLSHPRHPVIDAALEMARLWCAGHVIDGSPALGHAVRVALKLGEHVPGVSAELVGAALLHDAPEYVPAGVDLDAVVSARFGPAVIRVIRSLEREHLALAEHPFPQVLDDDPAILQASVADKIVSLTSILRRATASPDPEAYWRARQPFIDRVPYLRAHGHAAIPHVPAGMSVEFQRLIAQTDELLAGHRTSH